MYYLQIISLTLSKNEEIFNLGNILNYFCKKKNVMRWQNVYC